MQTYKPEGFIKPENRLSKKELDKAIEAGDILSGYVTRCDQELTLKVNIADGVYGEIPFSELEYSPYGENSKAIAAISKVGKTVNFKVKQYNTQDGKIVAQLSRKDAMKDAYDNYVSKLKLGDIVDAKITHVERYGAFCDIACGLTYLLPIEHFCVTRVDDAREALKGIKRIKAIINGKNKAGKMTLTHKELLGTFESESAKFKAGDILIGTVRSLESYGEFIELTPNLSGLAEYTDRLKVGDRVTVMVKSISPDTMKVKLSILDLHNTDEFENDQRIKFEYSEHGERIDHWKYSPDNCKKLIETRFNVEE